MVERRVRVGGKRDRRPGVGGDGREGAAGAEAREHLVRVGHGVPHDPVRLCESVAIGAELVDVGAQRVAAAVEVGQHPLAKGAGLGDHLPAPFAGGLDDRARLLGRLVELLGADARRLLPGRPLDARRRLPRPLGDLLGRVLRRAQGARNLVPDLLHELIAGRQRRMPDLGLEVGEPPVHGVELVGDAAEEGTHLLLVEALARPGEVLALDLCRREPGVVRAGRARLVDRHRANCIGTKGTLWRERRAPRPSRPRRSVGARSARRRASGCRPPSSRRPGCGPP